MPYSLPDEATIQRPEQLEVEYVPPDTTNHCPALHILSSCQQTDAAFNFTGAQLHPLSTGYGVGGFPPTLVFLFLMTKRDKKKRKDLCMRAQKI